MSQQSDKDQQDQPGQKSGQQANRDPITGTPGSHPIGTGVGAAVGGALAGAATGTVAGPVGTVVGAAVGAVLGGLAGKGVAEKIDPTREDAYWRENYSQRDYVGEGASYDDYGPAYRHAVESYGRLSDRSFDAAEPELSQDWTRARGQSSLGWDEARHAAHDAWQRLSERPVPRNADSVT